MGTYSTVQGDGDRTLGSRVLWTAVGWTLLPVTLGLGWAWPGPSSAAAPQRRAEESQPQVLRLSLDEAVALFLRQNLDLIMAKYGTNSSKAREITARLFPNPELSVNTLSAYTQGCTLSKCGSITPVVSQLFEVAGKRGFRIESARLGTQSAEASFEDTIRQLGYAVKDAYYRVQNAQEHLEVDEGIRGGLTNLLQTLPDELTREITQQERVRLTLLAMGAESQLIRDIQELDGAKGDLRVLLAIAPDTELELTTELDYQRVDPDVTSLRREAAEKRPDVRAKRLLYLQRRAELKLARATQYPDFTVGVGHTVQGPEGPDNHQQWTFSLGAPLPVFDRNQGGIEGASVEVQSAEADLQKTLNEVQNQVTVAYRRFVQSRKLVEAYRTGVLKKAQALFNFVQRAYTNGDVGILDVENTRRAVGDTKENYLDALFHYQRELLLLERAVGRHIVSY